MSNVLGYTTGAGAELDPLLTLPLCPCALGASAGFAERARDVEPVCMEPAFSGPLNRLRCRAGHDYLDTATECVIAVYEEQALLRRGIGVRE